MIRLLLISSTLILLSVSSSAETLDDYENYGYPGFAEQLANVSSAVEMMRCTYASQYEEARNNRSHYRDDYISYSILWMNAMYAVDSSHPDASKSQFSSDAEEKYYDSLQRMQDSDLTERDRHFLASMGSAKAGEKYINYNYIRPCVDKIEMELDTYHKAKEEAAN